MALLIARKKSLYCMSLSGLHLTKRSNFCTTNTALKKGGSFDIPYRKPWKQGVLSWSYTAQQLDCYEQLDMEIISCYILQSILRQSILRKSNQFHMVNHKNIIIRFHFFSQVPFFNIDLRCCHLMIPLG